jgi:FkbM family methyltransferase
MREKIKYLLNIIPGGKVVLGRLQVERKYRSMRSEIRARLSKIDIKAGDVVIDLGANIGLFSEYCLERGAIVYAYEPDPETYKKLARLSNKYRNFHPYRAAVRRKPGRAFLYRHHNYAENSAYYAESSSLLSDKKNVGAEALMVEVSGIEEVLDVHPKIALLKVDIEGAEYDIFDSIIENSGKISLCLMETHPDALPSRSCDHARLVSAIIERRLQDKILIDWF